MRYRRLADIRKDEVDFVVASAKEMFTILSEKYELSPEDQGWLRGICCAVAINSYQLTEHNV